MARDSYVERHCVGFELVNPFRTLISVAHLCASPAASDSDGFAGSNFDVKILHVGTNW